MEFLFNCWLNWLINYCGIVIRIFSCCAFRISLIRNAGNNYTVSSAMGVAGPLNSIRIVGERLQWPLNGCYAYQSFDSLRLVLGLTIHYLPFAGNKRTTAPNAKNHPKILSRSCLIMIWVDSYLFIYLLFDLIHVYLFIYYLIWFIFIYLFTIWFDSYLFI